jgi:hypothetical protein
MKPGVCRAGAIHVTNQMTEESGESCTDCRDHDELVGGISR